MPELPEVTAYVEALDRTIVGHDLRGIRMRSPLAAPNMGSAAVGS